MSSRTSRELEGTQRLVSPLEGELEQAQTTRPATISRATPQAPTRLNENIQFHLDIPKFDWVDHTGMNEVLGSSLTEALFQP